MGVAVTVDVGDRFRRLRRNFGDLAGFAATTGALVASGMRRAFREQRRGGHAWPARMVPNIPAIVQALARGAMPPARYFRPRPAGIDTGTLQRSIAWRVENGGAAVVVGSTLGYAARVHGGGPSRTVVPRSIARPLRRFLRSAAGRRWRGDLGWLFTYAREGRPLNVRVRARPFAILPKSEADAIRRAWETRVVRS